MELPRREDCFRVPSMDGEILGSNEMVGMKWLAPPSSEQHVILILNKLDTILQRRSVRMLIDDCIGKDDKSVRMIQTGRFEIFLETNDKGSACFDAIVHRFPRELPINAKELILDYCRKQASRDSRLYHHQQLKFGNFSIIATYGRAFQQAPHIDMIYPNFQFGCIVSENAPGTLLFDTTQYCCHIQTVKDLQRLWEGVHDEMPAGLALAMERSNDVSKLLRDFGDVLIPDSILHQIKQGFVNLPTGSVLSLPGSMIHAGPASSDFRAVIFFSGWPQDIGIAEYHPDTQYTGVQLCGQLVDKLWRQFGVGYHDRLYLLSMLLSYITHSNVKRHWAGHFVHQKGLSKFVAEATKLITPTTDDDDQQDQQQQLRALIERTARNNDLFFYNMADFVRVSVNGLQTVWENQIFEIYVFFRPLDGKILLAYPYQVPVTWEGTQQGEWYTLEMTTRTTTSKRSSSPRGPDYEDDDDDMLLYDDPVYTPGVDPLWFDGSNGILRDTEGNVITCFLKGGQHEFEKLYAYGHEQQEEDVVKPPPPIGL